MQTPDIDILTLIPQRPPFVMVDRLVSCTPATCITELTVRHDNIFVESGSLLFSGLVENVAQTCAARMGFLNCSSGRPVMLGVIGSIRNFVVDRLPAVGELLTTRIDVQEEVFKVLLVQAVVCVADQPIARSEMKIALTDTEATPVNQSSN